MPLRACVLTISTKGARGERTDESGERLADMLARLPAEVVGRAVVSDEPGEIRGQLESWLRIDPELIVMTGGTGLGPRDVTPQTVTPFLDFEIPGMAEAMRAAGMKKTPHAMLSRSVAGVKGRTIVLALPGSPRGAADSLEAVMEALPHGIKTLRGEVGDSPAAHRPS
jgi:molybdenum cofactor synthesis domain-containing protein